MMETTDIGDYQNLESLIKAVQYGDLEFVQKSIESYKMSPNSTDASNCSLLHWASINGRFEIVEYLIHCNANVNIVGGDNGEIPLQWAVRFPNCAKVVQLLLTEKSDLTHKSIYGYDALFLAVQSANVSIVYLLLASGANPNTVDFHGDTPLYWQLKNDVSTGNKWDMIRLLCKFHANVNHRGKDGNNALHIISSMENNFDLHGAFLIYSIGGTSLINSENNDKRTPYQMALKSKNIKMVRFLFDAYMYQTLPYYTPNLVNAFTLILFYVLLNQFGWLYGIGIFIPIFFGSEILLQSSIISASCRSTNGFVWGIIITATASYYIYLSKYFNSSVDYIIGITASLIIYSLYKTMTTKPAHIEESNVLTDVVVSKILDAQPIYNTNGTILGTDFRLCTSCLSDKASASTHCSKCNMCVIHLDHHCPFVSNCVGKGNRRMFLCFTISASFGCFLMSSLSFWTQHKYFCPNATGMLWDIFSVQACMFNTNVTLQLITLMAFFTALWIFGLTCSQLALIAAETTTFEMLKHGNRGLASCSFRGLKNIVHFVQTGQYFVTDYNRSVTCCNDKKCRESCRDKPAVDIV